MEKIIQLTRENIAEEHICCALSDKKGESGVASKKEWLSERFQDGLVFKKVDVRGKVFIEYIPADKAWSPVEADGYMFINCLWVAGQYKGKGLGRRLLDECIKDSAGMNGIVIVSSKKKMPFLADKQFLLHKGFNVCDTAPPYYELLCLKFNPKAPEPRFRESAKILQILEKDGITIYYVRQCPFSQTYARIMEEAARELNIPAVIRRYESCQQAQNAPVVSTTYSVFLNGKFLTHEIMPKEKFQKMLRELS